MEKTWRWFGKKDKITLAMLQQIGVEGVVTALHEVPNGEIWTLEAIEDLRDYIESFGLRWSVVESLPVCEAVNHRHEVVAYRTDACLAEIGKAYLIVLYQSVTLTPRIFDSLAHRQNWIR